jgi:quinolinate synthase
MPVVTYVNSTAAVKAESTICCTSANVVAVVNSLDADEMLLTPDRNLAQYAASKTKKKIHYWKGYCPIHDRLSAEEVVRAKEKFPDAVFMAHPECRPEVLALADEIKSTSGMLAFAKQSPHRSFIVGTEQGLLHPLKKANPDKTFYPVANHMICPNMKKTTLDDVLQALEEGSAFEVKVPADIRSRAVQAVERMLAVPRG